MVRRKLSFLATLSMLFLSNSAMAKESDLAYKGVTDNLFKKGKERNTPILGQTALQTSLVESIRFSGPFEPGYNEKGERVYTNDKSEDPLWNLTNILFPSNNGVLGDVFNSTTNFASYVQNPEVVALLLNYANKVRESLDQKRTPTRESNKESKVDKKQEVTDNLEPKKAAETLLPLLQKETKTLEKKKIKSQILVPLLEFIKASILEEFAEKYLYPQGITEQIISSFFSYHFNTQDDIWNEMGKMDDHIVDKSAIDNANPHSLLTREDIENIRLKPSADPFDLYEVFALASASIFTSTTPYKEGIALLNNGSAHIYNRTLNKFEGDTLPDCVETAIRHILNLSSYNPETRTFETRSLKSRTDQLSDPTVQLIAFLQNQKLEQVNQGDIDYRSAFNSIVADLKDAPEIRYKRPNNNEIRSGFINIMHVLSRIANIDLKAFPQVGGMETQKEWVTESLEKILSHLNPNRKFEVKYADASQFDQDLFGTLSVTAKDENDKDLYSYDVSSKVGHTEASNLKNLNKQGIQETIRNHPTKIKPNTTEESLWLLFPNLQKNHITHPLYKLFANPLSDNAVRILFLKALKEISEDFVKPNAKKLNQILGNVLDGISWNDPEILHDIREPLVALGKKGHYEETLAKRVKSILLDKQMISLCKLTFPQYAKWKGAQFITIKSSPDVLDFSHLKSSMEGIKKIETERFKNLKEIKGLDLFPQLEELSLHSTNLSSLKFDKPMTAFRKLDLSYCEVFSIIGIENLTALEELKLSALYTVTIHWKNRSTHADFEKSKPKIEFPKTVTHKYDEEEP